VALPYGNGETVFLRQNIVKQIDPLGSVDHGGVGNAFNSYGLTFIINHNHDLIIR